MNVVVRNVARDDQADRRDMQASRIPGISMARWNTHEFFTFKLKNAPSEFFCDRKRRSICPGNRDFQYSSSQGGESCSRITEMASRDATNRALGKRCLIVFNTKK